MKYLEKFVPNSVKKQKTNSVAISPQANYTDGATAAADEISADFFGNRFLLG
jgi:hypothetical protein